MPSTQKREASSSRNQTQDSQGTSKQQKGHKRKSQGEAQQNFDESHPKENPATEKFAENDQIKEVVEDENRVVTTSKTLGDLEER